LVGRPLAALKATRAVRRRLSWRHTWPACSPLDAAELAVISARPLVAAALAGRSLAGEKDLTWLAAEVRGRRRASGRTSSTQPAGRPPPPPPRPSPNACAKPLAAALATMRALK
jgi:hypothetical protein